MRFKQCFLHIGTEKTGSTTIQHYLEQNRVNLRKQGHYYPKSLGPQRGSHYYLVVYSRHEDVYDDLRLISGVSNKEQLYNFQEKLEKEIEEEFSTVNDCSTLHISCENFHSRLLGIPAIKKIKKLLEKYVDEFKIVCYLRPQHEVALSLYSTDMKLGGLPKNPIPEVSENNHYYNYLVMLEKWETVFGIESIIVRNFQRAALLNNDLITDYLRTTGVENTGLTKPVKSNESLSPEGLAFLGELNKYLPRFIDNKPSGLRKNIANIFEELYPGNGAVATKENVLQFYNRFSSSNSKVKQKYFKNDVFFEIDFSKYPDEALSISTSFDKILKQVLFFLKNIKSVSDFEDERLTGLFTQIDNFDEEAFVKYLNENGFKTESADDLYKQVAIVWSMSDYFFHSI